jgi:hypothetical protein
MDDDISRFAHETARAIERAMRPACLPSVAELGVDALPLPAYVPPEEEEEANAYQSAATLMRRLARTIRQWRASLPDGLEPAIMALLHGGLQIRVDCLAQEGFHGIRIQGTLDGTPCMVLAHQASVQLLCHARKSEPERKPRRIGFIIDGEETDA